jgi:hypothetical protein
VTLLASAGHCAVVQKGSSLRSFRRFCTFELPQLKGNTLRPRYEHPTPAVRALRSAAAATAAGLAAGSPSHLRLQHHVSVGYAVSIFRFYQQTKLAVNRRTRTCKPGKWFSLSGRQASKRRASMWCIVCAEARTVARLPPPRHHHDGRAGGRPACLRAVCKSASHPHNTPTCSSEFVQPTQCIAFR